MASIRRRNGKYQVQIRVGSYSRSQSFHKLNDAKSWARKEEELAEQRRYLGNQYDIYEENGEQVGQQFRTGTVPIDILGLNKDKSDFLVLELKRDRTSDVVVGQTLRYMGWVQEHLCSPEQSVNGCIIAHAQDERLQYALNQVPNIRFMKYEVDFRLIG